MHKPDQQGNFSGILAWIQRVYRIKHSHIALWYIEDNQVDMELKLNWKQIFLFFSEIPYTDNSSPSIEDDYPIVQAKGAWCILQNK